MDNKCLVHEHCRECSERDEYLIAEIVNETLHQFVDTDCEREREQVIAEARAEYTANLAAEEARRACA